MQALSSTIHIRPSPRAVRTVMLVHHRHVVRSMLAAELRYKGYHVLEASNGLTALRMACRHLSGGRIDALVIDVDVAVVYGPCVATRLQEMSPGLTTLLLGADAVPAGLESMATRCLPRPFSKAGVLTALHAMLLSGVI